MARFIYIFSLGLGILVSAPLFVQAASNESAVQVEKDNSVGAKLYVAHKCYECHRAEEHHIGPSWQAISLRYANEVDGSSLVDRLSTKVIKGGYGAWGILPMNSNPGVSPEDARTLVEWVLEAN